ncbi:DUF5677 domain-containing protein [Rheinheimera faecalis]
MSDYKKTYNRFVVTLDRCKSTSSEKADIPSPTSSHYYSSLIFTKLCTSAESLLSICPSPTKIGKNAHWDCASAATLTRAIVEAYLVFYYICIEECEEKEWQARWRLLNLHDHMSRLKMFNVMKGAEEQVKQFEKYTPTVQSDLEKSEFFKALSEKQRDHYLKGNNAFFKSQDELIESAGGSVEEFRFRYRFLSNHAHSYPMGFYRMAESGRGTGVESKCEIGYTGLCLEWTTECLDKAQSEFVSKWGG